MYLWPKIGLQRKFRVTLYYKARDPVKRLAAAESLMIWTIVWVVLGIIVLIILLRVLFGII